MNPQATREDLQIGQFFDGRLEGEDRDEFLAAVLSDPEQLERVRAHFRDRQLAERFHGGDLSEPEREAIETIGMLDPALFDELVLVERTRQAFRDADASGELDRRFASGGRPGVLGSPLYAAAASMLLVVSLAFSGVMYLENRELAAERGAFDGGPMTRMPLMTRRSGDSANVVEQPAAGEWTMLLVDSGLDYPRYRATIVRTSGAGAGEVMQIPDLEAGYDLQLAVVVPGRLLTPGEYELVVEGQAEGGGFERISAVPFEVEPRP